MKGLLAIRHAYWETLHELRAFRIHAFNHVPGRFGRSLRRRHYRTRLQACGAALTIEDGVRIQSPERLSVGDRVTIDRGCYVNASGGISIGSDTYLGAGTKIWTDQHVFADPDVPFLDQGFTYKPVCIEHDVWIGARCFLKPGVTIKAGAVIRPGSVLGKSVPSRAIVQGNPGKIVGWRGRGE